MNNMDPIPEHSGNDTEPYVFTTARWDPTLLQSDLNTAASNNQPSPIYLFEHHYTRLQIAQHQNQDPNSQPPTSEHSKFERITQLHQNLLASIEQWQKSHGNDKPDSLRLKIRSYNNKRKTVEFSPIPRIPPSTLFPSTFNLPTQQTTSQTTPITWTIVLDTQPTPITHSTKFKTSSRECYNRARTAAGMSSPATPMEVLLYTPEGQILDGSIATPYFLRGGKWITPEAGCGGLLGTTRRWALERGLAVEGVVLKDELVEGEVVWLSNAVRGFYRARFVARREGGEA